MNRFQILRRCVALGAVLGVYAELPSAASAQTSSAEDGPRTEVVSYAGLDLTGPVGQHMLNARIRAAAEHVCGPAPDRFASALGEDYSACMRRAQQQALGTVASKEQTRLGMKFAQNNAR